MTLSLGVDTGGTYTDAVLIRDERDVIATAKALTTRSDLAIGVGNAIRAVLDQAGAAPGDIGLASLSTTLATNALVEGQGGRVALVYIGFGEGDLDKHGLREALKGDPALVIAGGHCHTGSEAAPLDLGALQSFLVSNKGISGFAVAGLFATRNPEHELMVARAITEATGAPVTCSHQLSAKLNGPKRAVTAVLNARLIGMIDRLIGRAQDTLVEIGIDAPMMVVRGDGALMSAEQARERPIETILSGPAASIVGARWLTGVSDALVSDIGGTTTDVALIRNGRPKIDPSGAQVGGFRTMVEAVAMRTYGLGGDSQVHVIAEGLQGGVHLGPRRVLPLSLIAAEAGAVVHAALDAQLRAASTGEYDARFARRVLGVPADGIGPRETVLLDRLGTRVLPLSDLLRTRMEQGALTRLVDRGIVQVSGLTPSDASHVLGRLDAWDAEAAQKGMELFARKRTGNGERLAKDGETLATMIIDQLTEQTAQTLLETAFAEEDADFGLPPEQLARHVLTRRGLSGHRGLLALDVALNLPVVGLGASAASYYPAVGARLRCDTILPEHGGVANAIGAVVGRVTLRRAGSVTAPAEGRYRVHLVDGPQDFGDPEQAMSLLETVLRGEAEQAARAAGAEDIRILVNRDIRQVPVEGREVFIEAEVTVEASGRPRIAAE
ncbi:hydantoinase/oxoprolinase family protein [Ruegeria pomeroyi]|uniref:Hydantoinase/oxoprolinase family protein n=2 Tax=Ruegeria pomeroyi TaxID=89184 RepID=Q5LM25_RUEPO|nr:hydantoinase/oxoprolinase family protein [Ruegeria pomeroyi]AAV96960.1 hydantoinase/oxoprolinase family protein [Ruegeria pomeroyi DSS-3]NVK98006.1 hydantoinase/oxoprolinase family protein [Ruegeria pomeroyi]NVL02445.1 hydantoinase/oxoprolinase family protein [Ruegeria pomeroyi]QWV10489.1 hydantoinase/oxoprolinase family protein [Ruegeria pomeroyi]